MYRFVVIDLETTGLSPAQGDRITEIGIVAVENDQIVDKFVSFVNPKRPIPSDVQQLTGITDEMVAGAPSSSAVLGRAMEFIGDTPLFAHNATFEHRFLNNEFSEISTEIQVNLLCTMLLSRRVYPNLKSYKLGSLVSGFDLPIGRAHRALGDAKMTVHLLMRIKKRLLQVCDSNFEFSADNLLRISKSPPKMFRELGLKNGLTTSIERNKRTTYKPCDFFVSEAFKPARTTQQKTLEAVSTESSKKRPREPHDWIELYKQGEAYVKTGKYILAKVYFDKVVSIEPEHSEAHRCLGDYYMRTNDPRRAAASYDNACEIDGGNRKALVGRKHALRTVQAARKKLKKSKEAPFHDPSIPEPKQGDDHGIKSGRQDTTQCGNQQSNREKYENSSATEKTRCDSLDQGLKVQAERGSRQNRDDLRRDDIPKDTPPRSKPTASFGKTKKWRFLLLIAIILILLVIYYQRGELSTMCRTQSEVSYLVCINNLPKPDIIEHKICSSQTLVPYYECFDVL